MPLDRNHGSLSRPDELNMLSDTDEEQAQEEEREERRILLAEERYA